MMTKYHVKSGKWKTKDIAETPDHLKQVIRIKLLTLQNDPPLGYFVLYKEANLRFAEWQILCATSDIAPDY